MTVDGFVCGPNGELDWMTWEMGEKINEYISELMNTSDTILMGRKMTKEFVNYWENVLDNQPDSPERPFAQKMVDLPKIVFSKTVVHIDGRNVRVENGDLSEKVNELKNQDGKDLIVYGGASFVSSLIENNLIDELNIFIHPIAISEGLRIFSRRTKLKLIMSQTHPSGIVINTYQPTKE